MKRLTYLILFFLPLFATAQIESAKQTFESPRLKSAIVRHKIIAILPYEVKIFYRKQPKSFNAEVNREQEISMSKSMQASMYTFLLKRGNDYSVSFQDIDKTNVLLKRAGIFDKTDVMTKDEIAKVLGVDAVLGGRFEIEQTASQGAAIATTLLIGRGKTGTGSLFLTLNNGSDGELLWRFFKSMNDTIMGSTDDLVERMMRKVSRNFPYLK